MTNTSETQSLPEKSPENTQSLSPELDQLLDAMGLARLIQDDPSARQSNTHAKKIAEICTGGALADVREMCQNFRESKVLDIRQRLAGRIYNELDSARAGYAVGVPVTAIGG